MRRAQQDRPSIVVSEQLTTKILPMTPGHAPHFDSLEDGFFKEGDDLSDWQPATDDCNDPSRVCKPDRRLARRWPIYGAAIGVACILGFVLLGRARATAPRIPEPATQVAAPVTPPAEVPVLAEAITELPTDSPAPAPVAERQAPSPSLPATGAVAANPQVDASEACRMAFDRHRAKDVIATCPKAIDETPQSAELAGPARRSTGPKRRLLSTPIAPMPTSTSAAPNRRLAGQPRPRQPTNATCNWRHRAATPPICGPC